MNTQNDLKKRRFRDLLLNPFGRFLPLFILLFLLSTTAGVLFSLMAHDVKMALLHIAHGVILAYLLTFIIGLFPWKGARTALAALVILPLAILLYTDIVCILESIPTSRPTSSPSCWGRTLRKATNSSACT